jgi:hypothetical protein
MAPKEPTRAQLSSRLAYQSQTPSFLLKFKNRMNGIADDEEEYDEEFEHIVMAGSLFQDGLGLQFLRDQRVTQEVRTKTLGMRNLRSWY